MTYDKVGSRCAGGPQPGTVALSEEVMHQMPGVGSDGIYSCRTVRVSGSSTLSFHAEGRAWDAHIVLKSTGDRLAALLVEHHDDLGVQEVIWWDRRWDARTGTWARYTGDDNHHSHLHVAQTWHAATVLTRIDVRAVFTQIPPPQQEDDDLTDAQAKQLDDVSAFVKTAGPALKTVLDFTRDMDGDNGAVRKILDKLDDIDGRLSLLEAE